MNLLFTLRPKFSQLCLSLFACQRVVRVNSLNTKLLGTFIRRGIGIIVTNNTNDAHKSFARQLGTNETLYLIKLSSFVEHVSFSFEKFFKFRCLVAIF